MNVILLDNIENLGNIGDLVKVKAGYGRNFLIPHGKAALANPSGNTTTREPREAATRQASAVPREAGEAKNATNP